MDSRPHLTPRSTHIMCPLYIFMHTHAGPLVLSFARHAPLPSCLAAWAEHRNCFVFIALSGRPLSLSLPVCVFCFTGAMRVCALVVPRFGFLFCCFTCVVVGAPITFFYYRLLVCLECGRMIFYFYFIFSFSLRYCQCFLFFSNHGVPSLTYGMCQLVHVTRNQRSAAGSSSSIRRYGT
ncbi:hypothetical protein, conserved [Trypanosoma cruzi]|uniref:Uncharacterized protein n=1 Tax=Trypanosoma cruzi (strain CL Brener) TaxID=353153 RepID=Q4CKP1_TRYCC|nr:hypothetical protein, conserved [Trypanosoma cruzi]EAN80843.1 hypothetical protein, conserved [Trypanosoma cruzi]|eukprot:XP_802289.1 hypothetical protein [Trypanosoma cruzi strain CL Brener]